MKRDNQTNFYSLVSTYRAAYTEYDQQEAKKDTEAIWTRLKMTTPWACFVLFFAINSFSNMLRVIVVDCCCMLF